MTCILVIDDEPLFHQLVAKALAPLDSQISYAEDGASGIARARTLKPDVIITDVTMPDIDGYEVTRRLRREVEFASTPILVLTGNIGLQDKLKSFEAGADDHLTKPFEPVELAARVTSLLRRSRAVLSAQPEGAAKESAYTIAVHSLRGGTGCSTLSVNLGISLAALWKRSTALLDLTMTAGQVALMLNMTLRRTWADIARYRAADLEPAVVGSILAAHESGLSFVAAPTFPSQAETLHAETLGEAIRQIQGLLEYIVMDLPHDFSEAAIQGLDAADLILMVGSPDMASIRAATAAFDTYDKLGYAKAKIKFVLNATFPHSALSKEKIESALGIPAFATVPYVQDVFVEAINLGQPPVFAKPELPVSGVLEDLAFHLSREFHKKTKPDDPSEAWKRVYKRHQDRAKRKGS
jgi:pilus assembly protein CpaE